MQNDNSSGESTRSENASQEGVRSEDISFYPGEYPRVSGIMEKYTYGQQPLTKSEVRTLYVFAEKLYAVGSAMKIKIRLKLRYGM